MSVSAGLRAAARSALGDYQYLVERGYPARPAIELVGNRYRLTREERNTLYRGVVSRARAADRKKRVIEPREVCRRPDVGQAASGLPAPAGPVVLIDGHNVLYTIRAYLSGVAVFLCTDGVLRDAGAAHGKHPPPERLAELCGILSGACASLHGGLRPTVLLDAQLSSVELLVEALRSAFTMHALEFEVRVTREVDRELLSANPPAVIAGSDSVLLDRGNAAVFDLARYALERTYGARFLDLTAELEAGTEDTI